MASDFVVDAHALVWFLEGNTRLGQAAKQAMEDSSNTLHLPMIALAEVCWVVEKKPCAIPSVHDLLRDVDQDKRFVIVRHRRLPVDSRCEYHELRRCTRHLERATEAGT